MRSGLAVLGLVLLGCPQALVVVGPDAALTDATAADVGEPGVDMGAAPMDASEPDATRVDAGSPADANVTAARPPLTWSVVGFAGSSVTAVGCAAPDAVLVGTQSGSIIRLDGRGGQTSIWQSPRNSAPVAIKVWRDGARVVSAVATAGELALFDGLPEAGALRVRSVVTAELRAAAALGPGEVLALGDRLRTISSDFAVLRFPVAGEPSQVRVVHSISGVGVLEGLGYDATLTPPLVFTGSGRVFEGDLVARREANIELPRTWGPSEVASFDLHTIARVGGERFAAGERGAVYRRDAAAWVPVVAPDGREGDVWRAMLEVPGTTEDPEAYLVGRVSTPGRSSIARLFRGRVVDAGGEEAWGLVDVCFLGPDLAYAVGNIRNEFRGLVLRGTR